MHVIQDKVLEVLQGRLRMLDRVVVENENHYRLDDEVTIARISRCCGHKIHIQYFEWWLLRLM